MHFKNNTGLYGLGTLVFYFSKWFTVQRFFLKTHKKLRFPVDFGF